jgi:hypothetical protein
MSTEMVSEVVRLETINPAFRSAFRADQQQALALFANDLKCDGAASLTRDEINGILGISDEEFKAFAHIASVVGVSLADAKTRSASQMMF